MSMHHIALIIHLLSAAVWVGGHIVICVGFLPRALKEQNFDHIRRFEETYEPIGMPALLLLVATGVYMAYNFGATFGTWMGFASPIERVVSAKILCLLITIALAMSAQLKVLPALRAGNSRFLPIMALHIVGVTAVGILMLVLGSMVRLGGI